MKWIVAILAIGGIVYLAKRIEPEALLNRAMGNCYRSGTRNPDWYR